MKLYDKNADWLKDSQLAARYEVCRATIWRWTAAGHLPPPRKLGPGTTRWRRADIEAFEARQGDAA